MSIISLQFLFFVLGVILLYFIIPKKWQWIVLFIAMIFGLILTAGDTIQITFLSCVVIIVPVLYFLKWDFAGLAISQILKS